MSSGNPYVKDVTEASFERDVLERSHTVPVLVDFWAAWCGPCRVLGPLLEKEVAALDGRVELAKVDTDANQRLAADFNIRGIPAVKAFKNGQLVDEFVGALPVPQIREFLARLSPSQSAQGLSGALAALQAGKLDEAATLLEGLLTDPEVGGDAGFHLAHVLLGRASQGTDVIARVRQLAANVAPKSDLQGRVAALLGLADFVERGVTGGVGAVELNERIKANPRDHEARVRLSALQLASGDTTGAMDGLLESVSRDAKWNEAEARKAMLAVFDHLEEPGGNPELAREYRRKLQIVA